MTPRVKIISGGTVATTQVLVDGVPLSGVSEVVIHTISVGGGLVCATIIAHGVELVMDCDAAPIKVTA
jgi:hypothetical protein